MVDGLGNPLRLILSNGNRNDICLAKVLEEFDLNGKLILANKGYYSKKFTDWIEMRGGIVVIPSRRTNKIQRDIDLYTHNERHLVENLFLKLKNNRRFAARYEKSSVLFQGVTFLACILVWLI